MTEMTDTHRQPGPDFLAALANQSAASGLDINAAEFRQRAIEWRADQARIEELEAQVAGLERQQRTDAERERVLSDLKASMRAANDLTNDPAASAA